MSGGALNNTGASTGVNIGHSGTGVFNQSGGTVTIANNLYMGLTGTSSSTYNLIAAGILSVPRLVLGDYGNGAFNQTGGTATFNSRIYMGRYSGGNATYNLSGGTLSVASFEPNGAGTSEFNINGATTSGTIDGTWTTMDIDSFNVAKTASSTATFNLGSGKTIQTSGYAAVGNLANSNGTFNLNGGTLSVGTDLTVGNLGSGAINQSSGAVSAGRYITLGWGSGTTGSYNLSGGTLATGTGGSGAGTIGNNGKGTFTQTGGTATINGWTNIANATTANDSSFTISGGSSVANFQGLTIGYLGTGRVIQDGGTVNQSGTGYSLNLGNQSGVHGYYTLNDGTLNSQLVAAGVFGIGEFTQNGGTHGGSGTYNLNGGTLNVKAFAPNSAQATSTFNVNGITTSGTIDGDWTTLPVDNFNVGSSGSFTLASGKTLKAANISATGGSISGFSLDKFNITYRGFTDIAGGSFTLAEGSLTAKFEIGSSPIPEPATVVSVLSGLLMLTFRRVLRLGEEHQHKVKRHRPKKK
jgi:hypothetical protein